MSTKTRSKFNWNILWPWVEPIFAAILGIILYFPLQVTNLAEIVWIVGLLFTFHSLVITRRLKEEFDITHKLSEVLDLTRSCDVEGVSRILRLYMTIREAEFRLLKDDIIQQCITQLSSLAYDKEITAKGGEYYIWLMEMMQSCSQDERIRAISTVEEWAWTELPADIGYFNENLNAAKRGVKVERIFISSRERLRDKRNREVIDKHTRHSKEGLTAYIVWREELAVRDSALLHEVGEGLVLFGNRVAIIDTAVPPNETQGIVTMNSEQIKRCQRLFERLKLHAVIANTDLFNKLDMNAPF